MNKTDYSGLTVALILGAGSGSRAELGYNKLLYPVKDRTIIEYTLDKFAGYHKVITASPADYEELSLIAAKYDDAVVILGGATRFDSVKKALDYIENCDLIIIHDGARPNVDPALIDQTVEAAGENGGAVVYTPATDTVKETAGDGKIITLPRSKIFTVQTPQVFDYSMLCEAAAEAKGEISDDSQLFEKVFHNCVYITGDYENYKITTIADIKRFEAEQNPTGGKMRIGNGYDIHRFSLGRKLMLGGVEIPHYEGLAGHSDADAVIHAVCDSLLSASGQRDIGYQFPEIEQNRGLAGATMLAQVAGSVKARKLKIQSVSVTIITERPKLQEYTEKIKESLAALLGVASDCVGITAKTNEGLDSVGDNRALAVHAVCLLVE